MTDRVYESEDGYGLIAKIYRGFRRRYRSSIIEEEVKLANPQADAWGDKRDQLKDIK